MKQRVVNSSTLSQYTALDYFTINQHGGSYDNNISCIKRKNTPSARKSTEMVAVSNSERGSSAGIEKQIVLVKPRVQVVQRESRN